MAQAKNSPEERFSANVEQGEGCWEWQGHKTVAGYGTLWLGGTGKKQTYAHRYSYEMAYGPIPEGMLVCHHCDNPSCVRPDHLFLGTNQDNVSDMMAKRRHYRHVDPHKRFTPIENHIHRRHPELFSGENHWSHRHPEKAKQNTERFAALNRKLTEKQVREIKGLLASGELLMADVAARYGVSRSAIDSIAKGRTWAGIE